MQVDTDDFEFEQSTIVKVESESAGWSVTRDDGWSIFVPNEHCKVPPLVGETILLYGRGIGYPIRGIEIQCRVYRYETKEQHSASQAALHAKWKAEREARDEEFRANAAKRPPLPAFSLTDTAAWTHDVELNSADPYSYACVEYAAKWASIMEQRLADGASVADVAKQASHDADTDGITGFMYGAAVHMLARSWRHGDELRRWHNGEYGQPDSTGTANPALLTVSL